VERTTDATVPSLSIESFGDRQGVRVGLDDAVEDGIEPIDALEIGGRQLDGRQVTRGETFAELGDCGLEPRCVTVRVGPWGVLTVDPPIVARGSTASVRS
jgi:hypothetical protein